MPGSSLRWLQTGSRSLALPRALLALLTVGLIWQFVLVLVLVYRERGSLRWPVLKDALWLHSPRSPTTGRVGGRLWLVLIPALLIFTAEGFIPHLFSPPTGHDFAAFVQSDAFVAFMSGNWVWFALIAALSVFNTILGEELLFRGMLLPRMQGAFGRWDWVANGFLFALYHLHMPWVIPSTLVGDTFALSYPSGATEALIGIIVHSSQSVLVLLLLIPSYPSSQPSPARHPTSPEALGGCTRPRRIPTTSQLARLAQRPARALIHPTSEKGVPGGLPSR